MIRVSGRQQTTATCQRKFLLSGFTDHEKAHLALKIINLGSKYLEVAEYTSECTHIICVKPMRSEKYLCACAAGKWVLTKDYIVDSAKAGKWLKEEQYQWGIRHINDPIGQSGMARAPARWHRSIQETGKKAFTGWKVLIMVENKRRKPAVYKRVIECGDGKAVMGPRKDLDTTQFTHILVDKMYENDVDVYIAQGVPCVSPDYLAEFLFEDHPNIAKFAVTKQLKPSKCPSIAISEVNSTRSSRRSSRIGSRATSPTKSLCSKTSSPTKSLCSKTSSPVKRFSNSSSQANSLCSKTSSPAKSLYSKTSSPAKIVSSKTSSPVRRLTRASRSSSPADNASSTGLITRSSTPVIKESIKQEVPAATVRMTRTKAASAPATAALNTPVKATSLSVSPTQALINIASVRDAAETVTMRQEKDPLSFVPYWMQVTPPKRKTGDQCALAFPKVICNVIEACIEEGLWLQAVAVVTSNLSVSKFPPAELLHIIMQEIMQSGSSTVASSGYHMLKSVLCLHTPMASPSMRHMYLQSMLPPTRSIEGFELEDDTPIRCHWDFIDRVIRNCFPKMVPVDDASQEEQEMEMKTQMNNQLLLNYLVALLEQDFNGYRQRCNDPYGNKVSSSMMSTILWPTGHHRVTSSAVKGLLTHFISAVKHTQQNESMCILMRMLATLVGMCARLIHADKLTTALYHSVCSSNGPGVELAYELVSIATQDGIVDNIDCLHIMLSSIQPSWLKMCVSEVLLQDYDECLVFSQYKGKAKEPLSLQKLVNYYFYLLPKASAYSDTTENSSQESIPCSPLKKTTRNPRMSRALQTLADSNHTNLAGKKRKLDDLPAPKITSPMKKRRMMQINRRNAKGETQLHVACIKNDTLRLRQLLVTPGIQVNMTDFVGWTPLHEAANHGHVNCIKELIKFKPQANIMSFLDKESRKAFGGVDLLAAPSECGTTPLHDAVQNGHLDVVRLLVQCGGKSVLMAKNTSGWTPQDLAISDEMKTALQCGPKNHKTRTAGTPANQLKSSKTSKDTQLSNSCPSEELYETVLGPSQQPKIFISAVQAEQYCMVVRHLLRAYIQVHKLVEIKAEMDRRVANTKRSAPLNVSHDSSFGNSGYSSPVATVPSSASHNSSFGNCSFSSPVATVTFPLVKLTDIGCGKNADMTSSSDDILEQDLSVLEKMPDHVSGFIHHIERIGPWVGKLTSATCRAIFYELKLLVSSYQN